MFAYDFGWRFSIRPNIALLVALLAVWVFAAPAAARDDAPIPRLKPSDLAAVTKTLDADTSVARLFQMCPADAWRRRTDLTGVTKVTQAFCGRSPRDCLTQCLNSASGEYCFTLAQILQDDESIDPLYGEKLYLLACSAGEHGGCVNRAASLRNAHYAEDPLRRLSETERANCEYRSFAVGCEADDAWGCAMLGQAFQQGEGVTKNPDQARRAYDKSCRISPDFVACRFAKDGLESLDGK